MPDPPWKDSWSWGGWGLRESQGTPMAGSVVRRTFNVSILQRNQRLECLDELAKITQQVSEDSRLQAQVCLTPQSKFSTTVL